MEEWKGLRTRRNLADKGVLRPKTRTEKLYTHTHSYTHIYSHTLTFTLTLILTNTRIYLQYLSIGMHTQTPTHTEDTGHLVLLLFKTFGICVA